MGFCSKYWKLQGVKEGFWPLEKTHHVPPLMSSYRTLFVRRRGSRGSITLCRRLTIWVIIILLWQVSIRQKLLPLQWLLKNSLVYRNRYRTLSHEFDSAWSITSRNQAMCWYPRPGLIARYEPKTSWVTKDLMGEEEHLIYLYTFLSPPSLTHCLMGFTDFMTIIDSLTLQTSAASRTSD